MSQRFIRRTARPSLVAALAFGPLAAHASGFSLLEQSASRLGTAFAGTAAVADDATTTYYNPAGLVELDSRELTFVASGVHISSRFRDEASQPAFGQPLGDAGGDAGGWNFVPGAYITAPLRENLAVGLGINVPFGLKLEYDPDWTGRFQAVNSEISTVNFNPSIAWRVNPRLSVGVGISYQRIQAELTNAVNYSAVVAQGVQQMVQQGQLPASQAPAVIAANLGLEGGARVRGDDDAWGYNVGVLIDITEATRIGLSYRSAIDYHVSGSARFDEPVATNPVGAAIIAAASSGTLADGPAALDVTLPDTALLSLRQKLGSRGELLVDIGWTGWSSIQELRVVRDTGEVVSETPEKWSNVMRYALGGTYAVTPAWTLRGGVAYDGTEVADEHRTPRLPDPARTWLALGARWQPSESIVIDLGYAHLFADDAPIDQNAGNTAAYGWLVGSQDSSIDVLSTQIAYRF
ncbi:MAG TPA: outer membrane protein transport protein [Steroidobacteraceae bacterium]|nr:outer membrane protein transport protein [Steroidobacteraceae bacterium]